MEVKDNIIYFDNDNEFYEYAVVPQLVTIPYTSRDGSERYYTDFNFSTEYNDAVNNNMIFMIKDENSQICKRGRVSYRTITKDVSNLEPWFDDEDD